MVVTVVTDRRANECPPYKSQYIVRDDVSDSYVECIWLLLAFNVICFIDCTGPRTIVGSRKPWTAGLIMPSRRPMCNYRLQYISHQFVCKCFTRAPAAIRISGGTGNGQDLWRSRKPRKIKIPEGAFWVIPSLLFAWRRVNTLSNTLKLFRPGSRIRNGVLWSSSSQGRLQRLSRQAKTRPRGMLGGGWDKTCCGCVYT